MSVLSLTLPIWVCLCSIFSNSFAFDSLKNLQSLVEGESLISQKNVFELGFFSPGISENRYLGIWHKNSSAKTIVWIANRCKPIPEYSSGILTLNSSGNLVLSTQNSTLVWSTNLSQNPKNPTLQLLDNGNLVLRDQNTSEFLWQSFDYPTDTILPGMKLGFSSKTGHKWSMSAWRTSDDPCQAELICGVNSHPYPELVIRNIRNEKYYRHGPWNGLHFSGTQNLRPNPISQFVFVQNEEEVYFGYDFGLNSTLTRIVMSPTTSNCQQLKWVENELLWSLFSTSPTDYCDRYGICGANGNCVIGNRPVCDCLRGFKPKSLRDWNSLVWVEGCESVSLRSCEDKMKDGFVKLVNTKVPDTEFTWVNKSMDLRECREKCLKNCSCSAFANTDITGRGSGCVLWFGDLIDTRMIPGGGQDLFIRVPASELGKGNGGVKIAIFACVFGALGVLAAGYVIYRRVLREKRRRKSMELGGQEDDLELKLFDLSKISAATDSFSEKNKLGEGGFGPVYRGKLENGQEIAVKRLSLNSGQGVNEFKNEVLLIAKLQHRNLVKLLGCCIQEEEKLLVYEYMANKSLDSFIFDRKKREQLDWPTRFQIICGIARGLLYLHHDSRLRIVHRDLKASNVLLDSAMNPKISDFGMARSFGGDQMEGNTKRVVGTYGYMAPEYAFNGVFSVKSDIFSFGIMVLEIVSGKRCSGFRPEKDNLTLTGHAWKLMTEGKAIELIDPCLNESRNLNEVLRCIHVGLLCVQQCPADRPGISSVVFVLGSDNESELPCPEKPGYFIEPDLPKGEQQLWPTSNYMTMSILEAR